jgi:pilus assembly protein CpaB
MEVSMSFKSAVPLAVAIVLGLCAAILASRVGSRNDQPQASTTEFQSMVVAARVIQPGSIIALTDIGSIRIDPATLPAGAFSDPTLVAGRVAATTILQGQTLVPAALMNEGMPSGIASLVPEGMRAITIQIDEFSGVGGMIEPNSRVDIVARLPAGEMGMQEAVMVAQNIPVIAVGQRLGPAQPLVEGQPAPAAARSVTLLVEPGQAARIDLAASTASTRLVLRRPGDEAPVEVGTITFADLRSNGKAPMPPPLQARAPEPTPPDAFEPTPVVSLPPTPASHTITIIRKGVESSVSVEPRRSSDSTWSATQSSTPIP